MSRKVNPNNVIIGYWEKANHQQRPQITNRPSFVSSQQMKIWKKHRIENSINIKYIKKSVNDYCFHILKFY